MAFSGYKPILRKTLLISKSKKWTISTSFSITCNPFTLWIIFNLHQFSIVITMSINKSYITALLVDILLYFFA